MKKMIFILLFIVPILSFSQNKITLKSGDSFIVNVKGFYGESLVFHRAVPGTNTTRVNIASVASIAGKVPASRMKAILKENPDVQFLTGKFSNRDIKEQHPFINDDTYEASEQEGAAMMPIPQLSAGDLVQKSARLRLTGYAIGAGFGVIAATGAFNDMDSGGIAAIAGVSSAAVIGFFLAGEFTLIKAGRKMNSDAVSVSAAKSGVGVAINF